MPNTVYIGIFLIFKPVDRSYTPSGRPNTRFVSFTTITTFSFVNHYPLDADSPAFTSMILGFRIPANPKNTATAVPVCVLSWDLPIERGPCPAEAFSVGGLCPPKPGAQEVPCPPKLEAQEVLCPPKPGAQEVLCPPKPGAQEVLCPPKHIVSRGPGHRSGILDNKRVFRATDSASSAE